MSSKTLIDGTSYNIIGGSTLVDGTEASVKQGKTLIDGTSYDIKLQTKELKTLVLESTGEPYIKTRDSAIAYYYLENVLEYNSVEILIENAGLQLEDIVLIKAEAVMGAVLSHKSGSYYYMEKTDVYQLDPFYLDNQLNAYSDSALSIPITDLTPTASFTTSDGTKHTISAQYQQSASGNYVIDVTAAPINKRDYELGAFTRLEITYWG